MRQPNTGHRLNDGFLEKGFALAGEHVRQVSKTVAWLFPVPESLVDDLSYLRLRDCPGRPSRRPRKGRELAGNGNRVAPSRRWMRMNRVWRPKYPCPTPVNPKNWPSSRRRLHEDGLAISQFLSSSST